MLLIERICSRHEFLVPSVIPGLVATEEQQGNAERIKRGSSVRPRKGPVPEKGPEKGQKSLPATLHQKRSGPNVPTSIERWNWVNPQKAQRHAKNVDSNRVRVAVFRSARP
jgi:hypothetical protein